MIITDEALLRMPCLQVLPEEIDRLRELLETELAISDKNGKPGIGLSAPQIGIAKKMAIVRIPGYDGHIHSVDLVNCKIAAGYDKAIFKDEGCLSFPGRKEKTMR